MALKTTGMAIGRVLSAATLLLSAIAPVGVAAIGNPACQVTAPLNPTGADSVLHDAQRCLGEGRSTLDLSTLNAAHAIFEECERRNPNNYACFYGLARTAFYLAKAKEIQKEKDSAKRWRDSAITDVQHAIALNDRTADAHALLGDLYGAKITGMLSGIQFGPKANAEIQRAFQLDPNNAQAFAVVGRKYLYAPSAFGGDIDKAIDSFSKAIAFDPSNDEHYVWLAIAYRKKGDSGGSNAAISQALQLNGRSVFAKRVKSGATE